MNLRAGLVPRIVFMGSPEFALPSLEALSRKYPVCGVVTQPDRPAGRGRSLIPPPIKKLALELDLPVFQPNRLRDPDAMEQLRKWAPELIIVVAFGQILRQEVLDLPEFGCINVHASLLPRWRGAAPIQAAILNGDTFTGVTVMQMDVGVDTGAILGQLSTPIEDEETAGALSNRLAKLGADLLSQTLPGFLAEEIRPQLQDAREATYAPMLKKADGELDFNQPAEFLVRKVRAYQPWPGAFTLWQTQPLKILKAAAVHASSIKQHYLPGERIIWAGEPAIHTSEGLLVLQEVQPAGKKAMAGKSFLAGARDWI